MGKLHAAHGRAFKGFRTKSLDEHGVCLEYTDCFRTFDDARSEFDKNRTFLSRNAAKIVTVKVFSRPALLSGYKQYKRALIDVMGGFKSPDELNQQTALGTRRCEQIWRLVGNE